MKKVLFWLLSWTWGLPLTLLGALVALALLVTGHKPQTFRGFVYFEVGGYGWGGFEMGPFFVVSKDPYLAIKQHEAGHGLQNIVLGPLMPFVVSIPSAVRYWWREYQTRPSGKNFWELPPYDAIWFEGWATALGKKYFPEVEI